MSVWVPVASFIGGVALITWTANAPDQTLEQTRNCAFLFSGVAVMIAIAIRSGWVRF